ncbi:MAG: hypothetical protein ACYSUI_22550, partial [Planctomycetota bacterium]
ERNISEATRTEALNNLGQADALISQDFGRLKGIPAKLGAMNSALEFVQPIGDDVALTVASEKSAAVVAHKGRKRKAKELAGEVVANVDADEGLPLAPDIDVKKRHFLRNLALDVRNVTRIVENKSDDADSILHELMWRQMTRAHDKHLLQVKQRLEQVNTAAQRAGFNSLADAQAQLSGHGGKGVTQMVDVVIDGKETSIPMGQALWFAAIDMETMAHLLDQTPIVVRGGLKQKGAVISEDEIRTIRRKLPKELVKFVDEVKAIGEQDAAEMLSVMLELNGKEPRRVEGYFRRRRNVIQSDKRGLPKTQKDILVQYNENLGIGKERGADKKTPIIVEDFLTAMMGTINDTSKVIHVARPVRDAASVLFDPDVQTAINRKHGDQVNAALESHLGAASLARTRQDRIARVIRWINGSLAAAKLGLNITSILRQLGGIPRLAPILGAEGMADGMAGLLDVTLDEMTQWSGFFYERYQSNISSRFSPVEPDQTFGVDKAVFSAAADRAAQNFAAGDIKAGVSALREIGMSTLEILNFFDQINARMAWAAFKAQVQREHPEWSHSPQMEWVAEKASDAVRETQNSSSSLDLSTIAVNSRGNFLSLWLLFSSDKFKSFNRIRRAFAKDKTLGAQTLAAESVNIAMSAAIGTGTSVVTGLFIAMLFGDEDDREAVLERELSAKRIGGRVALDFLSNLDPIVTERLAAILLFQSNEIFDTAAGSSINDLAEAVGQIVEAAITLGAGDVDKGFNDALKGFRDAGLEAAALSGLNPLDAQVKRMVRAFDKLDDDDQEKVIAR